MVIEKKRPGENVKAFFKKIGTRKLIIAGAVLLIAVAVAVNWAIFANKSDGKYDGYDASSGMTNVYGNTASTDYFSSTQVSRTRARDEALEVLKSVIDDDKADEDSKTVAYTGITKIAKEMENESNIESLVTAKGFAQCVAVINDTSASIVVSSENDLTPAQLSQINEIVYTQAGILPENITVIKK